MTGKDSSGKPPADLDALRVQIEKVSALYEAETMPMVREALAQRLADLKAKLPAEAEPVPAPESSVDASPGVPVISEAEPVREPAPPHPNPSREELPEPTRKGVDGSDFASRSGSPSPGGSGNPEATPSPEPVVPTNTQEDSATEIEPPTEAQLQEADRLVALARLEKSRGNAARSTELLQQASAAAPGAPSVLEMLGDDLTDRKRFAQARDIYAKALALAPTNVGLETKHAEAVLRCANAGSVDDMLRNGFSDSPFLRPEDNVASAKGATFFNLFLPGLGQIVMGATAKGAIILVAWLVCVALIVVLKQDINSLVRGQISPAAILPLIIGGGLHLYALADTGRHIGSAPKRNYEKPRPPVDLPFE